MTIKGLLVSKEGFICIMLFCFYVPDCDDSQILHVYSGRAVPLQDWNSKPYAKVSGLYFMASKWT